MKRRTKDDVVWTWCHTTSLQQVEECAPWISVPNVGQNTVVVSVRSGLSDRGQALFRKRGWHLSHPFGIIGSNTSCSKMH